MKKALTQTEVMALFETEAILLGSGNGVPLYRVAELFGNRAADFAFQVHGASNAFGIGDYNLPYLNNIGFRLAASYRNVEEIRKELEPEVRSA